MSLSGQLEVKHKVILPDVGSSTTLGYSKTTILAAAIKTLVGTAVELVAAPGANHVIHFLGALLELEAGSNVLTESTDNLIIDYDNGTGITLCTIEATGFIDSAADIITNAVPLLNGIAANSACVNKNIALLNNSGNYAGNAAGDAILTVHSVFRIINLG